MSSPCSLCGHLIQRDPVAMLTFDAWTYDVHCCVSNPEKYAKKRKKAKR
jgi:hypothetical protein